MVGKNDNKPSASTPPSSGPNESIGATDAALAPHYQWRFGTAEFDSARFELKVGGLLVELQQKPLQLLALLLRTPGELVDKDLINDEVWEQRATGDAVLANAVSKLRNALGEANAQFIVTVPRQGYRFEGTVERITVGRRIAHALTLSEGSPVPHRHGYILTERVADRGGHDTWRARQPRTGDERIFKFATNGERLADLKREVTLFRLLRETLGESAAIARIIDWNFETPPFWIESEPAGVSLLQWSTHRDGENSNQTRLQATPLYVRLELFLQIADAAAAAHSVGVLHKDLKPANILIEAQEQSSRRTWRLRLTDFGSGRLLEPDRLQALAITQMGMTLNADDLSSGTLLYIAPELLRGESATVQADLYSLGVVLYQLLAGDLTRPIVPGWERDVQDPLLIEDIASATDVDPQRRLSSVTELAHRIRSLDQRRTEKQQQLEQQQRFAEAQLQATRGRARRPWIIGAFVALLVGLGTSVFLYFQQRETSTALSQQIETSDALNRLLREDLIGAANPALQGRADVTVADALSTAANSVDLKFANATPQVRGTLHAAMQNALAELSRSQDAVAAGQRAVSALSQSPSMDLEILQNSRLRLALDLVQLSKLEDAQQIVADIESQSDFPPLQAGSDSIAARIFQARLLFVKSWIEAGDLSMEASTQRLQEAFALIEDLDETTAPGRGVIMFGLADNLSMMGKPKQALELYQRLYEEQVAAFGANHIRPLYTLVGIGRTLGLMGQLDRAKEALNTAATGLSQQMGTDHRHSLTALDQLAEINLKTGHFVEAADQWRIVHRGFAELLGENSSYTITIQTNLGTALHRSGELTEAANALRTSLQLVRSILPEDAPQTQQVRYALADCLLDLNKSAEARTLLNELEPAALNLAQQEADWPRRLERIRARAGLVTNKIENE